MILNRSASAASLDAALVPGDARPCADMRTVSATFRAGAILNGFPAGCLELRPRIDCEDSEIALVDDGSPVDSMAYAFKQRHDTAQLVVVDRSQDFGHHHAMLACLCTAQRKRVFQIDCNFLVAPAALEQFDPGHCETGADMQSYYPQVIIAGQRSNESIGKFNAEQAIKQVITKGSPIKRSKVDVLGLTCKEDSGDLRNSKVIDNIREL